MARTVSSVDVQVAYVKESTWGVTPANPQFKLTRVTNKSLTAGRETVASEELRPDRNVVDLATVSANAGGSIDVEFSYGTFDDFLSALFFNPWQGNSLTNGVSSGMQSFTLEERIDMGGGAFEHFRYQGMVPNTVTLTMGTDALMTGTFEFMGKNSTVSNTKLPGATYIPPTTSEVLNATNSFSLLSVAGKTDHYINSLELTISNNLREQRAVGYMENIGVGTGQFAVTGTMDVYFQNVELVNKYLDDQEFAVTFVFGEEPGKQYKFTMPRVKFSSGEINTSGNASDVMQNMGFQALFSPDINGTMRIERDFGVPPAPVAVTDVILDVVELNLVVGNSATIIATVNPSNATNKGVTWTSSDSTIATVLGGVVTGVATGTATITAETLDGGHTADCTVTVE